MLEDLRTHLTMVTRVLVFGLLSMTLSYLTGLNKQQAIFPLLMTE